MGNPRELWAADVLAGASVALARLRAPASVYKIVQPILLSRTRQSDHFWPSQQKFQDETGCSRSTVRRALKWLEERGLAKIQRTGKGKILAVHIPFDLISNARRASASYPQVINSAKKTVDKSGVIHRRGSFLNPTAPPDPPTTTKKTPYCKEIGAAANSTPELPLQNSPTLLAASPPIQQRSQAETFIGAAQWCADTLYGVFKPPG